jgi:TRAP-type mannitol/chloroaromatic compound transport system permease small subunit
VILKRIVYICETITEWVGKLASWLLIFLILSLVYEVISRHFFNSPTFWAHDMSYMLGGAASFLGIAWVQKNRLHVRVDIFYEKLTLKKQALVDVLFTLILFFPVVIAGLLNSVDAATLSWIRQESAAGAWRPPIYPLKTIIPIALGLLLLQGIADLIRNSLKLLGRDV